MAYVRHVNQFFNNTRDTFIRSTNDFRSYDEKTFGYFTRFLYNTFMRNPGEIIHIVKTVRCPQVVSFDRPALHKAPRPEKYKPEHLRSSRGVRHNAALKPIGILFFFFFSIFPDRFIIYVEKKKPCTDDRSHDKCLFSAIVFPYVCRVARRTQQLRDSRTRNRYMRRRTYFIMYVHARGVN